MSDRRRLVYVTAYDAHDVRNWSGLGTFVARALEAAGCPLDYLNVGPPTRAARLRARLLRTNPERDIRTARRRARIVPRDMRAFSPGSIPVALVPGCVFWTDATFASMVDFYPAFTGLPERARRDGHDLERRALANCAAAIYSSEWAAASAIADYHADPEKVHVVPFGANFESPPEREDVLRAIERRGDDRLELLFAGSDWKRKGGDTAIDVAELLRGRGHAVRLTVIGASPRDVPSFVEVRGFLHKQTDAHQIHEAFERAHFLVLPTRAECSANVFNEASAFGVPSATARVGGVETAVRDGANGLVLPADAPAEAYVEAIEAALGDYAQLARSARGEYEDRLNWSVSAKAVVQILDQLEERSTA